MSNLVVYKCISPNRTSPRNHAIDRITVHYMDGNLSIELCGEIFADPARRASSNYGIGPDGRIALYVDEADRSWCSGSSYNDNRAVTIECANLVGGVLTSACWESLVKLCADICRRNGIPKLVYTGDDTGNLTKHKWYDDTDCPGPWLDSRFGALARQVNDLLAGTVPPSSGVGGKYVVHVDELNVRDAPSLHNGNVVAVYTRGMAVMLDDWCLVAEGYAWGRYTAYSGKTRYVAIGRYTGKAEATDFLIRVD